MHFLVDRSPKDGYRARCGVASKVKTADMTVWGSEITCPRCLS